MLASPGIPAATDTPAPVSKPILWHAEDAMRRATPDASAGLILEVALGADIVTEAARVSIRARMVAAYCSTDAEGAPAPMFRSSGSTTECTF